MLHAHLKKISAEKPNRYLQIGLDENSPLNAALRNIRQKHVTKGKIFYVTRGKKPLSLPAESQLEVGRI
ncbi:MAG: hypothetical protein U5L96_06185 [Owenweeksia sp.]|nr:hypothetical protein [Owenweeksia sp.]